jgi:hypothetical protein
MAITAGIINSTVVSTQIVRHDGLVMISDHMTCGADHALVYSYASLNDGDTF